MTTIDNTTEIHTRLKNFSTKDIKNLIQNQGKLIDMRYEFILKDPAPTDARLIAVVNDPYFEVFTIKSQHNTGEMYYDLKANGQQVRINIACQIQKKDD